MYYDYEAVRERTRKKFPTIFSMTAADAYDYLVALYDKADLDIPEDLLREREELYNTDVDPDRIPFDDFITLCGIMANYGKQK